MKTEIELKHETFGVCATAIYFDETGKQKTLLKWRHKYGKTIDKCTIHYKELPYLKPGQKERQVINKATKDVYLTATIAAKALNVNVTTIYMHCKQELNPYFQNKVKYA